MGIEQKYAERAWDDHVANDAVPLDLHLKAHSIGVALDMMKRDRTATVVVSPDAEPSKYVALEWLAQAQDKLGIERNLLSEKERAAS